jgi:dimethylamine/trimethylamine dehydrogenase
MSRDPRYDILFEPVAIGPVTARNRFYQVPHCNGMGHAMPNSVAAMRGMKAEGGWAVVATEECDIHASTDVLPYKEARLWDDADQDCLALMADRVHEHGALAAIELTHSGHNVSNRYSRLPVLGVSDAGVNSFDPVQACAMTRRDIADVRRWHRQAAIRARDAGFDIVYVYAGHDLSLPMHFISRRHNRRSDEYGGSLENRVRLTRELLEDTKDAVGDRCGIAIRFAVDELLGDAGIASGAEGREVVEMLAEMPDLWDVNVSDWANDSVTARFGEEGAQESYVAFVKQMTTKPVVGVGRFTSADAMVSQIKRGILDMIGAARPSIADPFLPRKIEEGRIEDIRECIGCNICVSGDWTQSPIRCTQNPTMGEEWRRGWHPEIISPRGSSKKVLVVGAGPAGLEAAMSLGQRGYEVALADSSDGGGRAVREATLPGLASYKRVSDYRLGQIARSTHISFYPGSKMDENSIREFGADQVLIATGSYWRADGLGRATTAPVPGIEGHPQCLTPDDIMAGTLPAQGPILVYDDDHYYLGGVIAQLLADRGLSVTLATPGPEVSCWTQNTMEQHRIEQALLERDVKLVPKHTMARVDSNTATLTCNSTGRELQCEAVALVMVTLRAPVNDLYFALAGQQQEHLDDLPFGISRIGDCMAPATIAAAVYDGHRAARELDNLPDPDTVPFKRERSVIDGS